MDLSYDSLIKQEIRNSNPLPIGTTKMALVRKDIRAHKKQKEEAQRFVFDNTCVVSGK